ncbi:MAG TPA: hypothetical protein PL152_01010, partial [Steroidobacteraceae bacterium]|nr:hypothetical protein [Steroidobacteraceae bacterium]
MPRTPVQGSKRLAAGLSCAMSIPAGPYWNAQRDAPGRFGVGRGLAPQQPGASPLVDRDLCRSPGGCNAGRDRGAAAGITIERGAPRAQAMNAAEQRLVDLLDRWQASLER